MDASLTPNNSAQKNSAPDSLSRTLLLERCLESNFGLGDSAKFESRFSLNELPLEEAQTIMRTFRDRGWSVDVSREDGHVVFAFSNPPPGAIALSASHAKTLQTLLARIKRFISTGLPEGIKSYPLVERYPYRVVAVASELLRAQGLEVTISLGSQSRPKAIVVGMPAINAPDPFGHQ